MVEDSTDQAKHQQTTTETERPTLAHIFGTIFVVFLLYFLSISPVTRYGRARAPAIVDALYSPLVILVYHTGSERFLEWYMQLWFPNAMPVPGPGPATAPQPTSNNTTN